jgi:hypothetical protein
MRANEFIFENQDNELIKAIRDFLPIAIEYLQLEQLPEINFGENFADGKNPGRRGLAKRSGVNTKASVSDLRRIAKNSSGEKARMAHWLANMKSGKKKQAHDK